MTDRITPETNDTDIEAKLGQAEIFAGLTPDEDRAWSKQCTIAKYAAGAVLGDYGKCPETVFIVQSGHLRATMRVGSGKELFLDTAGPGATAAEIVAIHPWNYDVCLMATTDSVVVLMPIPVFQRLIAENHHVCTALLSVLTKRLQVLHARLCELSYLDVRHRLYTTLLRLSEPLCPDKPRERWIAPPVIHSALAEHIGARRETVSREMSRLTQDGVIERDRKAILIRQPHELLRRLSQITGD
ncbi:Crp/Fnr family transcriptional regulator [Allorhizobium taibaishanense]|uniref:CRP-like cAMP-binding protein n=1 Tax=Allorhizobium taibaishanense TaxID=887144 RepID=A0A1Q9A8V4_9HYPH|nr:Crp/Fnr family transcriptional regulator [Allorhizobium taibaishanense]MBB4009434.1 CRP-like cAMP-binding protein [Allorhizobium taibaishanense]OLP51023.1 hypothetical protein BJF91_07280 [Allorhizobium taibaishanense]